MIKVLIVEDDILVTRFIVKNIRWERIGVKNPLQARNGIRALEIIRSEKPDVIILDIHLPKMNGIDMLKMMHKEGIKSKVIILSGHDDFEYAQQAVKLGVEDYLLKPVLAIELENKIVSLVETIKKEEEKIRAVEALKKQVQEQIPVMRLFYINNLLNGVINNIDEAERKGKYLDVELKHNYNTVILCSIEFFTQHLNNELLEEENNIIRYKLSNLIKDTINDSHINSQYKCEYIVHSFCEDQIVIILNYMDIDVIKKFRDQISRAILEKTLNQKEYNITLGYGNIYEGLCNIRYSYMESQNAIKYKFIKGNNQIIDIKDVEPCNNIYYVLPIELEKKLENHIKLGDYDRSKGLLKEIFEYISKNSGCCSIENTKLMCYELISITIKVIFELGGQLSDIFKENNDIYSQFQALTTMDEFYGFMDVLIIKITEYINNKRYLKYRKVIKEVKEYIINNYQDEELDLNKVARIVNMNPSYLSHIYKNETNETFSFSLKKYRMEKAREHLLDANMKICDVAFSVGFKDAHYFSNCFKEVMGITPSQFREANIV